VFGLSYVYSPNCRQDVFQDVGCIRAEEGPGSLRRTLALLCARTLIHQVAERNCLENSWTGLDRVFSVARSGDKGALRPVLPTRGIPE
jgi:hypothetical protein